jgi:ABC-type lipoprotein release transport system permease subunit
MNPVPSSLPGVPAPVRSIVAVALRLTRCWWREVAALAAACGVVAATIAGALGVGDAMGRGLRQLAVARLGGIEAAVMSDEFFRAALAGEMAASAPQGSACVPAIVLQASAERTNAGGGDAAARPVAVRTVLLACDDPVGLGFAEAAKPAGGGVAVNAVLAESLGVAVGDTLVLRIARRSEVPSDSPLGRRTADADGRRLRVARILPREGLGQFAVRPAQVTGPLAVVSLAEAQGILRRGAVANAVFVVPPRSGAAAAPPRPTLEDLGLDLASPPGSPCLRLTSRRLLLPAEVDRAAARVLGPLGGRPSLVFLANELTPVGTGPAPDGDGPTPAAAVRPAAIPYSTVVGLDTASHPVGDLVDDAGRPLPLPGPGQIVIDRWMADDLAEQGRPVAVGDSIELRCFLPETVHGRVEEARHTLRISGIAAMEGAAVARELVPDVEGITDEKSIADWDPPFPFDGRRVRTTPPNDQDDRYWKRHGATPKAFVSLETARRLAGGRFGGTTAWHLPLLPGTPAAAIGRDVAAAIDPERVGMRLVPLRAEAVAAARGSTPFGGLFLALSSFVVLSGLLLQWLLFNLLVAARRRDLGTLSAVGWPSRRLAGLLLVVGGVAAVAGVAAGTLVGPVWSSLLLRWLAESWNSGVAAGSSQAFGAAAPRVLLPGAVAGGVVSLAALAWACRRASRQSPLALLHGRSDAREAGRRGASDGGDRRSRPLRLFAAVAIAAALAAAWAGRRVDAQAALGLFFLAGSLALAGLLAVARLAVGGAAGGVLRTPARLAWRGLAAAPGRTFSVVAIVALAEFLIVAVSSFAVGDPARPADRHSPTGGWTFIATFGTTTGVDPADAETRATLGLSDTDRDALAGCTITRLRATTGDDASCTNLYAAARPVVLGVGPAFIARGGFRFVDHAPLAPAADVSGPATSTANPWTLLDRDGGAADGRGPAGGPVPAILDEATARWALKLGGVGSRFTLPDDSGNPVDLEIVGLLEPGILQGHVIVSELDFQAMHPRQSGYSMALVDAGGIEPSRAARAVAAAWSDAGVSVQPAVERLRSLLAVQNTFLAGFQALGTLGLLLGTAGVAAVQIQSVLERAGALGLMRAVGFSPSRIRQIVVLETLGMVGLGLVVGLLAGCIAVLPSFMRGRAGLPLGWIAATATLVMAVALVAGLVAARGAAGPAVPRERDTL